MNDSKRNYSKMPELLAQVTRQLSLFLDGILPTLTDDWWNKTVISTLSYLQISRIKQFGIITLSGLDLAGLLRVFDGNWHQISSKMNFPFETRHFVKEMQTIRNRWAHADAGGFNVDDVYRDLDTLQRFAAVIGTDDQFIQSIRNIKASLLTDERQSQVKEDAQFDSSEIEKDESGVEFNLGQIVQIKSNPSRRGAIISISPATPENRISVFIDGGTQTFYSSQLMSEDKQDNNEIVLDFDQFHAFLTAQQINYPGLSTLYSLNAARVDFIPYQFRPVFRFIRSDRPRLLIADGVGVGKTIEAGLILRELQARRDVRSVLIICPRPLVTEKKWQNEMKRFDERFTHLDGPTLRYCINEMDLEGAWPEQHQKVILSYSLLDESILYGSSSEGKRVRTKGLLDLDPSPRFDLVIVDEAHHIRNQDTLSHKAVRFFCDHAEAVVFLTATPIQLGSNDLFVLLNTLRPDLIIDKESFAHMAEPNPFINRAVAAMRSMEPEWQKLSIDSLEQAASTPWGQAILKHNPDYTKLRNELLKNDIEQVERVKMISLTEGLHTFAGIINRTRRRDIDNFTVRKPETVNVPFTDEQQHLHDELLRIQAEVFSQIHDGMNVMFMMTTIRRQAASCLFGLAPFLEDILNRHIDELSWEEADDTNEPEATAILPIQSQINDLLDAARLLSPNDPKLETLRAILRDKQGLTNNKVMLFSSFRHTLSYLYTHLKADGFRVGLIHGGTPDEDRVALRAKFEKHRDDEECLDVLLFSEIGCEGLDYQFCDCIVNYDLPWNPMRIEQRIGRIDRNGQKSESVAIVNMITPGTVDADIYERCLLRIGVFNNALGGSEEILGDITREIKNIAENYTLNEGERKNKLQQLADNKIRLIQEQEDLEIRQAELFGIRLPQEQLNREIGDAASFWLTPESLRRLVTKYLQRISGKEQEFILGEKQLKTLRVDQETREKLLREYQQLVRQNNTVYREWETWLKGDDQHLSITFESDCAMQQPKVTFMMPLHPLVKQAALMFETKQKVVANLSAISNDIPPGKYLFAIYQWRFHGIKEDLLLKPIASNALLTEHLNSLLEQATESREDITISLDDPAWDELDSQHYNLWNEARIKHKQRIQELAEYRQESISTSHRARIAILEDQLSNATNSKIQRMRQTQIGAANSDYARRIQELEMSVERADIVAGAAAYGIITINKE